MGKWKHTIRLQPEWDQAKDGEITTQAMAGLISAKLGRLPVLADEDLEETRQFLIEDFAELAKRDELGADDFDELMVALYDWADTKLGGRWPYQSLLWVDTSQRQAETA